MFSVGFMLMELETQVQIAKQQEQAPAQSYLSKHGHVQHFLKTDVKMPYEKMQFLKGKLSHCFKMQK